MTILKGIYGAMCTPFQDSGEGIDLKRYHFHIDNLLEDDRNEAGKIMLLAQRGTPKNRKLLKLYQQQGMKQLINQVESEYIIITENSIYVVSADIPTKRVR